MPVQINEVVIKVVVDPQGKTSTGTSSTAASSSTAEAVSEMVLKILKEKNER